MGSACSRIRRKASHVDDRELYESKGPHPPWPSPSSRPEPRTVDLSRRPSEALEKGRHEAAVVPPSARAHKITPCSSEAKDVQTAVVDVDVGSGGSEAVASTEENKDEKRRLSRILSGRASSVRSMTSTVAKKGASRVLGKAMEAFDNLGSSVANRTGATFAAAGVVSKANKIGILAFEVANTIVKASNLKQSLSEGEMRVLKEETLVSDSVQLLISTDYKVLMSIAASDKRHELKIFTDEVVRFGNHCRDPQWHNLDQVFNRLITEGTLPHQSKEEANRVMDELMILAQSTAELYHELHALDRLQIDLKRKQQEEEFFSGTGSRGSIPEETVILLKSEVKSQERHVKTLKRKSLWAKVLEEVMEQLVDIVYYLYQEIQHNFGPDVFLEDAENGCKWKSGKLGTSGLALHYANIINQIDTLVSRPSSVPAHARDNLYQGLPPTMKSALKGRLQQNSSKDALTMEELKSELYKILDWMVPVASNTTNNLLTARYYNFKRAHHGFGWVGEWANTGSSADRKSMGYSELTLLQTLHHANQQKVEAYILELIVGLHHLVCRARKNKLNNGLQQFPHKLPQQVTRKPSQPFIPPERNISPPPPDMFASSAGFSSERPSPHSSHVPAAAPVPVPVPVVNTVKEEDEAVLQDVDVQDNPSRAEDNEIVRTLSETSESSTFKPESSDVVEALRPAAEIAGEGVDDSGCPAYRTAEHDAVVKDSGKGYGATPSGRRILSGLSKSQEFASSVAREHVIALSKSSSHSPSTTQKLEQQQRRNSKRDIPLSRDTHRLKVNS